MALSWKQLDDSQYIAASANGFLYYVTDHETHANLYRVDLSDPSSATMYKIKNVTSETPLDDIRALANQIENA